MDALVENKKWLARLSVLWSLIVLSVLWCFDFPKPMIDDLFYSGAALNLAQGGDLSNPMLARQGFPSHYFFVYPPGQSFALAAWLKIFGISANSITGFQMLMYFIIAVATIAILRRNQSAAWLEWLVPFGVCGALLGTGLRSEPLAIALSMTGFAIISRGGRHFLWGFAGFFLIMLGGSVAPRITPFGAALCLIGGYGLYSNTPGPGWSRWRFLASGFFAGLAVVMLSLTMISFRISEFLTTFRFHAQRVAENKIHLISTFLVVDLGITQWPILLVALVLLVLALIRPRNQTTGAALAIAAVFPLAALIGGLGPGTIWFAVLLIFILSAFLSDRVSRSAKIVLQASVVFCLLLANSRNIVDTIGVVIGKVHSDLGDQRDEALSLKPTVEHPLLVDFAVARYLYDYRIPEGALDWDFGAPFPGVMATEAEPRAGDIYLLSPARSVKELRRTTFVEIPPAETWVPIGLRRWALVEHPRRVLIIRAENCHGLRIPPRVK